MSVSGNSSYKLMQASYFWPGTVPASSQPSQPLPTRTTGDVCIRKRRMKEKKRKKKVKAFDDQKSISNFGGEENKRVERKRK